MRILHILDHSIPLHSGYAFRTKSLLTEQRKLGWETFQITSPKHHLESGAEEDVGEFHFYRTPVSPGLMRLPILNQVLTITRLRKRLFEVVDQIKPDILHAHSPSLTCLAALAVGRKRGIPVVYEARALWEDGAVDHGTASRGGLRYRITRGLENFVFRRADAITTICNGLKTDIEARGIPAEKITVIPNAVNTDSFHVGIARDKALEKEFGLTGKTVLGFIGSFYGYEGLAVLIDSMPRLIESSNIVLLLVGGGPCESDLKQQAKQLGIADKVIFAGRRPHEDIHRFYSLIDILIYPRLSSRLTELVTPLKPLEAMALGKLVVASDVGGHRELIEDGKNGILFTPGSSEALAKAIVRGLEKPEIRSVLAVNGREYVEHHRTWTQSVTNYKAVYPALLRDF